MTLPYSTIIRRNSPPLKRQPTSAVPRLRQLSAMMACLFDIYRTMVISSSGDADQEASARHAAAFVDAVAAMELTLRCDGGRGAAKLLQACCTSVSRLQLPVFAALKTQRSFRQHRLTRRERNVFVPTRRYKRITARG